MSKNVCWTNKGKNEYLFHLNKILRIWHLTIFDLIKTRNTRLHFFKVNLFIQVNLWIHRFEDDEHLKDYFPQCLIIKYANYVMLIFYFTCYVWRQFINSVALNSYKETIFSLQFFIQVLLILSWLFNE